jgi:hypothetical protein
VFSASKHAFAVHVSAEHAEPVGIGVEVVVEVPQYDDESLCEDLNVNPDMGFDQCTSGFLRDRCAALEKPPRAIVAEAEVQPSCPGLLA